MIVDLTPMSWLSKACHTLVLDAHLYRGYGLHEINEQADIMKESRKVTTFKCDHCGHVKSDDGLLKMGGSPFDGWYSITRIDSTTVVPRPPGFGEKDFCSEQCIIGFFTDLINERYEKEQKAKERPIFTIKDDGSIVE